MSALPTGTVTFLFTDIEGSTKLAQGHGENWETLRARHHAILQSAIESHNGYVFQIIGDAFCVAFHTAGDALQAAIKSQVGLQAESWGEAPVKVRMGIHTGKAELQEDGQYHGYLTMSRIQRLMSAGHGGQTLISSATQELVRDELPEGVTLHDLGEKRLKDLIRPERIHQLNIAGLLSEFPPIKTLDVYRHNLPTQLTSFIGREKEITEIKNELGNHRLITLTGSGGTGKTRLSMQVAAEVIDMFPDGVWFLELAPITDPTLIPYTLGNLLGLRESAESNQTVSELICGYFRSRNALVIFDNCEHLIESCARLADLLLRSCKNLKILASSREALGVEGEMAWRVPSLSLPDLKQLPALEQLSQYEAVRLFIERATLVQPHFTVTNDNASIIAQICFRLDGVPLALELAAARMKVLSPEQIASRLDDRFRLLTGGSRTALPRQQTLRAMIDWSYSLLSAQEKVLFRRLAVFVGGWTLEAAESVCREEESEPNVLDLLTRLVDKSLVLSEESKGEIRYQCLETIRQYSREKFFETDEVETIRDRHLAFYVKFAEIAEGHMRGRARVNWTRRITAEQDNLRTAMEWGLARNPESALRIAGSLPIFWTAGGYSAEGFRWIQRAMGENMEKSGEGQQPFLRAKGLSGLAFLYMSLGDNLNGKRAAEESVALFRQSQDKSGLAYALVIVAFPLEFLGERLQAEATLMEGIAIARSEKNAFVLASALNNLTRVTLDLHGDTNAAERYADEAIRVSREAGIEWTVATAHEMKGNIAFHRKEYDEARAMIEKAVQAYREIGAHFNVIIAKSSLAHMERLSGNYAIALDIYRETIVAFRDIGQMGAVAHQLECFGFIALAQDHPERTLQLFAAANALREKVGTPMTPDEQIYFDEQLKGMRDELNSMQFDSIWSKGYAMTMEQAIDFALEEIND